MVDVRYFIIIIRINLIYILLNNKKIIGLKILNKNVKNKILIREFQLKFTNKKIYS